MISQRSLRHPEGSALVPVALGVQEGQDLASAPADSIRVSQVPAS